VHNAAKNIASQKLGILSSWKAFQPVVKVALQSEVVVLSRDIRSETDLAQTRTILRVGAIRQFELIAIGVFAVHPVTDIGTMGRTKPAGHATEILGAPSPTS
jgi:hypothetical protein